MFSAAALVLTNKNSWHRNESWDVVLKWDDVIKLPTLLGVVHEHEYE